MSDLEQIKSAIYNRLLANPSDLTQIQLAVSAAMEAALARSQEHAGKCSFAMLSALTLADAKRLTPEMRQVLYDKIADAIDPKNCAPIERNFLAKAEGRS